jgi:glycine dehydrogenase
MSQISFSQRHIGPNSNDTALMLKEVGAKSLTELVQRTVPENIYFSKSLDLPQALSETEVLSYAKDLAKKNKLNKNYIGLGYYGTLTPNVILRNILENPGRQHDHFSR